MSNKTEPPKCTYCITVHMANSICKCDEDCGSPYCPAAVREEMYGRAHP